LWLLAWLVRNASKVIAVVSTYYNRIIDAAKYALTWAISEAAKALEKAKAFVIARVAVAYATLIAFVNTVRRLAIDLYEQVLVSVFGFYEKARSFVLAQIAVIGAVLRSVFNAAIALVYKYVGNAVEFIRINAKRIIDAVLFVLLKLIPSWNILSSLITLFGLEATLSKLIRILGLFPLILMFFTKPIEYLVALFKSFLLTFLQFSVAYGMGTKVRALPPWPNWSIPIPQPIPDRGPVPGGGGLAPPLRSVYVSGNTFGVPPGHNGINLGLDTGDSVFSMHDGTVTVPPYDGDGYGNYVIVRGGDWWTLYAHNSVIGVSTGERVEAGEAIAQGGSTGNSSGPHLHLEIKYRGSYVNPINYL
jgi:hypothetical protein